MMKYLQKLGRSLMLPVACLPVAGILMGIGYALSPHAMQGGDITGTLEILGFFLIKAGGALIFYRTSTTLKGDISDDHKIHKVIETESVDGTKVTFKGGKKMVYLASWMKDGQNHSLDFYRPVTRDMAKAMIRNIVEEKSHTK